MTEITKVVIPVAGLGTRFAPATKAIPKEMLPVVDTPAIQYVVEEAVAAGLTDILMVTGRGKEAIENHFDNAFELEANLQAKADTQRLDLINASTGIADIHYIRQGQPLGLGHAVNQARAHVGTQPFAVQLGDDLIDARHPILPDMVSVQRQLGGSVIALMEVPHPDISL
ncbi:MAG TPA: sugar phosphate nucleotidyltransferase, partial [Beutenbergiaceae bacterium]|nr:sugar phosphate nucleotidyltransferase [Beutenbergiaceae bacterium]